MNERIKELALEAGIVLKRPSKSWSKNPDWMKTNPNMPMEKFAELLIRECASLAYDGPAGILEHFGVESE